MHKEVRPEIMPQEPPNDPLPQWEQPPTTFTVTREEAVAIILEMEIRKRTGKHIPPWMRKIANLI